jgi:HEAT repeat protein
LVAKALKDQNPNVRIEAAFGLMRLGPRAKGAVAALAESLEDTDRSVRRFVVRALKKIGPDAKRAVPSLVLALNDKDPETRIEAACALWRIEEHPRVIPFLYENLRDAEEKARLEAAQGLNAIGSPALPSLKKALADPNALVRRAAAETLGRFGPRGISASRELVATLKDDSAWVRVAAAKALWRLEKHQEAIPALIRELKKPAEKEDPGRLKNAIHSAREGALYELNEIGAEAKEAVPIYVELLDDPLADLGKQAPEFRQRVESLLQSFGPDAKPAVHSLIRQLEAYSGDFAGKFTCRDAVRTLRAIGPGAKEAVPALTRLLKIGQVRVHAAAALWWIDKDPASIAALIEEAKVVGPNSDRSWAVQALGEIGSEAQDAVPAIALSLTDKERGIRAAAAVTLGRIGPGSKDTVPALVKLLKDSEPSVRFGAAVALWRIEKHPAAVPALVEQLKGARGGEEVTKASSALIQIGTGAKEITPELVELLKDSDGEVRVGAAEVLWCFARDPRAMDTLCVALKNKNYSIRFDACKALARIGSDAKVAVDTLIGLLNELEEVSIPHAAAEALGAIGPDARKAFPVLTKALEHPDSWVRWSAAGAMKKIDPQAAKKEGLP